MHSNLVEQAVAGAAIAMIAALGAYVIMRLVTRLTKNVRQDHLE
jgi:hypothetical protein